MKVAIAVGDARRFVVGDPDIQLIDVLAGRLDRRPRRGRAPRPEGRDRARPVGDRARWAIASSCARAASTTGSRTRLRGRPGLWSQVEGEAGAPAGRPARGRWSGRGSCPRSTSGCGPGAASSWRSSGRPIPVFVRFGGIDYDDDDDAIEKLDEFVRAAQRIVLRRTAATSCS